MHGLVRQVVVKSILSLAFIYLLSGSSLLGAKATEKEKFDVRVINVKRSDDGCRADVRSDTVYYHISSVASGACTFLRAGGVYKAFIFSGHGENADPTDHSQDKVFLIIQDRKDEEETSVFNIDSEEAEDKK